MKPSSAIKSSSSSRHRRLGSALKQSRRQQQQPPKPPASTMLGAAVEWLAERGVSLMNALGYSDNNAIASKERTARARSKSPSIVSLSSGSMEDDWYRLRKNDLKVNDTDFYEIAQEILLESNAVTQSGLLPSSSQFQESMNRYIASLLKDKNIEPNEFMEALQYRVGKVPMFLDPNNETKLMSATSNLASLLKVKPIPDMGYMDNIIERQTTKLTMSTDSESQSGFLYPPPAARAAQPEANNMVPPPSEPLIPPLEHPPINKQRNTYFHRQPIESFIQQHPLPEQLEQGYRQQQQQQQQRYYSSSAIPQESRFGEPNQNYKAFPYVPSSLPQLWPHQSYANNVPHVPPHRALQLQEQQIWNDEPDDIFLSRSMMEDVPANTPYQLGMVPPDEGGEYGTVPPQRRLQMLLSQERQKVMLEIYNVTELLSRSTNDPLRHRMYKKQLLTLQSELESLYDDFTSANVSDTVKSDQAENRSIASAATISKANYTGNKSIASAASISKGAKLIVQEKQNSVSIVKKNSREEKSPSSSSFAEKVTTEKPVVLSPTAEQILATTYHETADEGVKQILLSQDMSKPIATAGLKGEQRGLTISTQKDEPLTNKSIGVIKVRAPMTMPEGYTFEAKVGENVIMIKVPEGGVKKGQIFDYNFVEEKQMYIPLGRWRYPLFSCCVHGANHPMFCNGLFCPQVALSQIMARLHLNSCANPVLNVKAKTNAISILLASIALIMLHSILISLPFQSGGITIVLIEVIPLAVLDLLLILYFFVLLVKTRIFVRQMYKIEGSACDDVTSSVFCTCCTVIQMGYHTADYETYTGVCCSSTGLPPQLQALSPHSIPPPEFIKPFSMC